MKLSGVAKKMVLIICVSLLLIIAGGGVYYRFFGHSLGGFLCFALGAALGAALNVVKLILLERMVDKAVTMEKDRFGSYIRLQNLFRLLLTALVLVAAVFVPFISLWGCVAGILTLQASTLIIKFLKIPEQGPGEGAKALSQEDGLSEREVN